MPRPSRRSVLASIGSLVGLTSLVGATQTDEPLAAGSQSPTGPAQSEPISDGGSGGTTDSASVVAVDLAVAESVYASQSAAITVTLTNRTESEQTRTVVVERSTAEIASFTETLAAGASVSRSISWTVPASAAGHTLSLTARTDTVSDRTVTSAHPEFPPDIHDVTTPDTNGTLLITYEVTNAGGAPDSQEVTLQLGDADPVTRSVDLGPGESQTFRDSIFVPPSERGTQQQLQVSTESASTALPVSVNSRR